MNELCSCLGKATVFTKLDLKNSYYLICMAEGEEWKTAFKSRYGLYQYNIMLFGLYNVPISKRSILRAVSPHAPCVLDVPGAYNVNSSSECVCPGLFRPEVKGPHLIRPDATGSVWMH